MQTLRGLALPSLFGVVALASAGCGVLGYPTGSVYTGTRVPSRMMRLEGAGQKSGDARGEACATGILGLAAFGDASLAAAKRAGGITDVHSVEFRGLSLLGIYTQGCTVAHGSAGGGGNGHGGGGAGGGSGTGGGGFAEGNFSAGGTGAILPMMPGGDGTGAEKSTFGGAFSTFKAHIVDHCPTDNLLATMEETGKKERIGEVVKHFYYRAKDEADRPRWEAWVALQKTLAALDARQDAKVFTWVVQPAPIPKPPAEAGAPVFACEDLGNRRCTAYGADASAQLLKSGQEYCSNGQATGERKVVPRCPAQGLVGRCEFHRTGERGSVTYYYNGGEFRLATDREACGGAAGSWSAP